MTCGIVNVFEPPVFEEIYENGQQYGLKLHISWRI